MKSLVIYFSRAFENYAVGNIEVGNTEIVANIIKEFTGADLFKCEGVRPYSKNYNECCKEAKNYLKSNARPQLKQYLKDISNYDIIYIGGPIYYGQYPFEVYSELDKLKFDGKIIKPFSTHEGSKLGNIEKVLTYFCKGATVKPGLAILGHEVKTNQTRNIIKTWVYDIN